MYQVLVEVFFPSTLTKEKPTVGLFTFAFHPLQDHVLVYETPIGKLQICAASCYNSFTNRTVFLLVKK